MARLIDVDKALAKLRKVEPELKVVSIVGIKAVSIGGVIDFLERQKTVDAAEVVHGRWIRKGAWHIECSECKHVLAHIGEAKNYCPNCGAKNAPAMDGERKNNA